MDNAISILVPDVAQRNRVAAAAPVETIVIIHIRAFLNLSEYALRYTLLIALVLLSSPATAQTYGVVVSGLGGESQYTEQFAAAGKVVFDSLQSLDVEDDLIVYLDETATRETILAAIDDVASRIKPDEPSVFSLFFIGHGNADSDGWRFNVSGPDVTSEDLVASLNPIVASEQLVVLATSASGAALDILAQPQRVVVTATKSGGENNAVKFPEFMAQAMRVSEADYDRNEILTIAEVFRFAQNRTAEYYEQQKLLAPEHARLKGESAVDIPIALLGSLKNAKDDPAVASLLDERLVLEDAFKLLKRAKTTLTSTEYYTRLEQLLLKIARLQQSIDTATGWSESDAES
nr:hypothetical protein [Granulosicoccus sp.]